MTSLIGMSAQALADELRQRGIVSIKVDEWSVGTDGAIVLSPSLSVGVTACGCHLLRWSEPYVGLQSTVIGDGIFDVETLQAAITKAKWKRAKS